MRNLNEILQGEDLISFLNSCEYNFEKWCTRVLGIELQPFQKEWVQAVEMYSRIAILAPSGFGKTTMLGIAYPLWKCWFNSNFQTLIVSNSLEQSWRITEQVREIIDENELLVNMRPTNFQLTWNKQTLIFSNRSRFRTRPFNINIKGEQVDFILCDEASSFKNTVQFFDYVVTRAISKKGKIVCISTPESPFDLMAQLKDNSQFFYKAYPAIQDGQSIWAKRFSIEYLMKTKRLIGEELFQKNYMVNPQAQAERPLFPMNQILNCCEGKESFKNSYQKEDSMKFIVCDFAISSGPRADFDVYIVGEKIDNILYITYAERHRGFPIDAKVQVLKGLYEKYKPIAIYLDESHIGRAVLDELKLQGIPVRGYTFDSKSRENYLMQLRIIFERNLIRIPSNKEDAYTYNFTKKMIQELGGFNIVENPETGTKKYIGKGHDDIVMTLALLAYVSTQQKPSLSFFASG